MDPHRAQPSKVFTDDVSEKMRLSAVHIGGDDATGAPVDVALGVELDAFWTPWNREQRGRRGSAAREGEL